MQESSNLILYEDLIHEITRIQEEVEYRKHLNSYKGHKGKRKDYPAVSVGAELFDNKAVGHHHNYSHKQDFHPLLLEELNRRLGELNSWGVNYRVCKNFVGHCAENYAASKVLNSCNPSIICNADILSEIQFTEAIQPRTWKNVDWCANCHTMFD